MAESISFTSAAPRSEKYSDIIPQIESLVSEETDMVANLANIAAVLKEVFGFFWVGFYLFKNGQLVLGPFQGPLACTRIDLDKGVCGAAFTKQETIIVPNVNDFPGHIACSSSSRSEIVVPIFKPAGELLGVLDADSERLNDFGNDDRNGLEEICRLITRRL
jgi:L-methionine (R)-S-oxide reductase